MRSRSAKSTPRPPSRPGRAGRSGEAGITAVWTALLVTTLVAFAGLAVDLGNWYLHAGRQQNAADAGSLGGVVFMPGSLSDATAVANQIAGQHGYDPARVSVAETELPNQLRVTIDDEVQNTFLAVIGLDSQHVSRTAIAEYEAPARMGSPLNIAGNDPEGPPAAQPDYWVNAAAPEADKRAGDRFATKVCASTTASCDETLPVNNLEFSEEGYFFGVTVPAPTAQPLRIQIFDVSMYSMGDHCDYAVFATPDELESLRALTDGAPHPSGIPADYYGDAPTRYAEGETGWCTGDVDIGGDDGELSIIVRRPDGTPWTDTDNELVTAATCQPTTAPHFAGDLQSFDLLFPEGEPVPPPGDGLPHIEPDIRTHGQHVVDPTDGVLTFAETFRRWTTVCEIPADEVEAGEYVVQLRTNADAADPLTYDPTVATGGHNRLSMRAGFASGDGVAAGGMSLYAKGRFPVFANASGATTNFDLVRLLPGGPNRHLAIELFDMGDAADPGTLRIEPPPDSNVGPFFTGCTFNRDDGAPLDVDPGDICQLNNVEGATGYNGRLISIEVPIAPDYTCAHTVATGCWVKVRASFPGGVADTTTWAATMNGDPVRLVE